MLPAGPFVANTTMTAQRPDAGQARGAQALQFTVAGTWWCRAWPCGHRRRRPLTGQPEIESGLRDGLAGCAKPGDTQAGRLHHSRSCRGSIGIPPRRNNKVLYMTTQSFSYI